MWQKKIWIVLVFILIVMLLTNIYYYMFRFEAKLPEIFKDIHEAYEQIDARLKAEQFKVHINDFDFFLSVKS